MEYREDIWKRETRENVNFTRELSELNDIKILVKNAVNLYDELGGDKNLLGEEVKNEIQNEEKKLEEENKQKMEEERINIRGRRRRNEGIIF